MNTKAKIRVVVADNHFSVRIGLKNSIDDESDLTVIADVATGRQAIDICRQNQPDVALIDWNFPDMTGLAVVSAIQQAKSKVGIVMLSTFDGAEAVYRAQAAGASAYLLKSGLREEMLQAIRAVAAGQSYFPPDIVTSLAKSPPGVELRAHELQVLKLVTRGRNYQEIAASLSISEDTVQTHIGQILAKLEVTNTTQAITKALQRGLLHLE